MRRIVAAGALIVVLFAPGRAAAAAPLVLDVWPGTPPGDLPTRGPEKTYVRDSPLYGSNLITTNVTRPTISVYLPVHGSHNTGTAVVICPGGGYWDLYLENEGEQVAAWLNFYGMTGIVLKYRVPRPPNVPESAVPLGPQMDAQRAVSLVRSRAAEWGIDPRRIGILGSSVGGHLAIATATNFARRTYAPLDDIDTVSSRPDFAILCYSGFLKADHKAPATSLDLWPGLQIPPDTPPVFLVHATDDTMSPADNSVIMYLALERAHIPVELHVFARGEHDFGVRQDGNLPASWPQLCINWLRALQLLEPKR